METQDEHNKFAIYLGRLVSSLQSLEFVLRTFLLEDQSRKSDHTLTRTNYQYLKVGDHVPVDAFTNYDTLGELICQYNKMASQISSELCINQFVVVIRDAIVHGRVAAYSESGDMHILKFSKPKDDQVEVTFAQELDPSWFKKTISDVQNELAKVRIVADKLDMNIFHDS